MSDQDRESADQKLRRKFEDLSSGLSGIGAAQKAALGLEPESKVLRCMAMPCQSACQEADTGNERPGC